MLTYQKKAAILIRTGTVVPPFPTRESLRHHGMALMDAEPASDFDHDVEAELERAIATWNSEIEMMFVDYAAARAAKSLRDAEHASQLSNLRLANSRLRATTR